MARDPDSLVPLSPPVGFFQGLKIVAQYSALASFVFVIFVNKSRTLREPISHARRARIKQRCEQSPRYLLARPNGTREPASAAPLAFTPLRRAAKAKIRLFLFDSKKRGAGKRKKCKGKFLIFAGSLQSFQNAFALFLFYLYFNDAFFHSFSELALPPERLVTIRPSARTRETPRIGHLHSFVMPARRSRDSLVSFV